MVLKAGIKKIRRVSGLRSGLHKRKKSGFEAKKYDPAALYPRTILLNTYCLVNYVVLHCFV
jgi:hypothetical protein